MGQYGNKAKFVVGDLNPKRQASKKARKFGLGFIGYDAKESLDKWCQSKDPLFKVKGKERHRRLNLMR